MKTIVYFAAVLFVNCVSGQGGAKTKICPGNPNSSDFQKISTKNKYKYIPTSYDFSRHRYVIFEVKACHDAHINLMADNNVNRRYTYEIIIGALKTFTLIKKQRLGRVLAYRNKKVLDCNKFVKFWISWDHRGTLRVGTSDAWLITLFDRKPYRITRVSVSTGYGATGEWKVYNPIFTPRKCCKQASNVYCIIPGMSCNLFTQQAQSNPLQYGKTYMKNCRFYPGLKFSTKECVCDHAWRAGCSV